jgi:hypothetical protein
MRFGVSTAVNIEILVFWIVTPSGFINGSRETALCQNQEGCVKGNCPVSKPRRL